MHHLHTVFIVGSSPTVTTKFIVRWQSGPMQWIANPQNREFESHSHFQVWPISSVVEHRLDKAGVDGSFPSLATSLGLKVFTDAHDTVTVEEGDRYPLGPPNNVSLM